MEKLVIEHFRERLQKGEYISRKKIELLPINLKGKLLEVGCGTRFTYFSEKLEMYGVDITPEMVKLHKKLHPKSHSIIGDVRSLPFKGEVFDIVVSNGLLHHLVGSSPGNCKRNIEASIREIRHVLNPRGILLIVELLVRNYLLSLFMFYVTFLCAKFGIEINSLDIHSKVTTFYLPEKDLKKILEENNFKINETQSKEWRIKGFKMGERFSIKASAN